MTAQRSLSTPLCRQLGITHPIFGFSHSVDVTVAITLAGGFAVLGVARDDPEHIARALRQVRAAVGARRFGVDLMFPRLAGDEASVAQAQAAIPQQHRDFVAQLLRKHQVPAATRPTFFTAAVRNAAMFEAQLDAVLASDVDLVAAAVGVPAEVVTRIKQRGKTALVDQLLQARSEDTLLTRSHSGKPCRVLGSGWTDEWHAPGAPEPLPMPYQQVLTGPLVAAVEEHSVTSLLYTPAGQSVAWVQQRETVQAVIDRLVAQARLALDNLGRLIGAG